MAVLIDLAGDPSFDLDLMGQSNLHGRVEWKPSTNEYRVVKDGGTAVAITGTQTRPKNRALSNIGLNDPESPSYGQPQCQWDNAAWEPAISRTAPASFTGNAVASWRLFDDSDRCWWVVVEAVSDQLVVWLHRPATIFLQAMQPFPEGGRELNRFYLPSHLVGEPVHVAFNPRGNKAVLQVVSDKSDVPLDVLPNSAPERYTVPWAQFMRVLDFAGTGSWPEQPSDPTWGVGIESVASFYVSPYGVGQGSLSASRSRNAYDWPVGGMVDGPWLMQDGEKVGDNGPRYDTSTYPLYYAAQFRRDPPVKVPVDNAYGFNSTHMVDCDRAESIDAPLGVYFSADGVLHEFSWDVSYSESVSYSVSGFDDRVWWGEDHGAGWNLLYAGSGDYDFNKAVNRSASMSVKLSRDGVQQLAVTFSAMGEDCSFSCSPDLSLYQAKVSDIDYLDTLRFVVGFSVDAVGVVVSHSMMTGYSYGARNSSNQFEYSYVSDWFKSVFWASPNDSGVFDVSENYRINFGYPTPFRFLNWSGVPRIAVVGDLCGRSFLELPDGFDDSFAPSVFDLYDISDLSVGCLTGGGSAVPYLFYAKPPPNYTYDAWIVVGYC